MVNQVNGTILWVTNTLTKQDEMLVLKGCYVFVKKKTTSTFLMLIFIQTYAHYNFNKIMYG